MSGMQYITGDDALSGYDKSPDYGGPDPTRRGFLVFLIAVVLVISGAFYYFSNASAQPVGTISYCTSSPRITCVVDGDTLWLDGVKIRLKNFDTPEPQTNLCGGAREKALANKASSRLIELLNNNNPA